MDFRLYTVRVWSTRWPEVRAFYRDTLGLPERYGSEAIGWAEFDLGGPSLGLERTFAAYAGPKQKLIRALAADFVPG
jgi:hypothetical protein